MVNRVLLFFIFYFVNSLIHSSGKLQRLKTRDMLAKKEFKVLYELATGTAAAPATAQSPAVTAVKSSAARKGTGGPAPVANFATVKAPTDLFAAMRSDRTYDEILVSLPVKVINRFRVPQCSPEAQKFCDGVAMAAPVWSISVRLCERHAWLVI